VVVGWTVPGPWCGVPGLGRAPRLVGGLNDQAFFC